MEYLLEEFCESHHHSGELDLLIQLFGSWQSRELLRLQVLLHCLFNGTLDLRAALVHFLMNRKDPLFVVCKKYWVDALLSQNDVDLN